MICYFGVLKVFINFFGSDTEVTRHLNVLSLTSELLLEFLSHMTDNVNVKVNFMIGYQKEYLKLYTSSGFAFVAILDTILTNGFTCQQEP